MAEFDACYLPLIIVGGFFAISVVPAFVRIVLEYERGIVFTLGRYAGKRGAGINIIIPFMQYMRVLDMRIHTLDIPKQEVLTKDNISVFVNAVVYYKVVDPEAAVLKVQDYANAIFQHGQAAMREIIGSVEFDTVLSDREGVATKIQQIVAKETNEWGVQITSINMQDIELPADLKKAMARQAQAEREKRATVIISGGEVEASAKLSQAAGIIASSPGALHLRTLQSLSSIASDKTNYITFILPLEGSPLGTAGKDDAWKKFDLPEPKVSVKKK